MVSNPSWYDGLYTLGLRSSSSCQKAVGRLWGCITSGGQPNPYLNLVAVGLTPEAAETQIREHLENFGPLRGFDLVKGRETGNSKGYGFCAYQGLAVTDIVCAALNAIKMGDKTLTVRRANQGKLMLQLALVATKKVCLTYAASANELKDDEDLWMVGVPIQFLIAGYTVLGSFHYVPCRETGLSTISFKRKPVLDWALVLPNLNHMGNALIRPPQNALLPHRVAPKCFTISSYGPP
ncbi:hypothetical protein VNO77_02332 [Canavalia gladiata]|uniref:RRM domain-containing protein n=1 Tax=Canavalia gladiata TaxID=3824 RepID=A0AAN9MTK2_CANGL